MALRTYTCRRCGKHRQTSADRDPPQCPACAIRNPPKEHATT